MFVDLQRVEQIEQREARHRAGYQVHFLLPTGVSQVVTR
jgi:hypothetical protein